MDLGIKGKTALVCAASKGLGKGCAMALAREGVNLVITARGKEARLVATDGHRLAMARRALGNVGSPTTGIVPRKAITEIMRVLGTSEEVEIALTENQFVLQMPNFMMTARLIEGQFPNYEAVIPKAHPGKLTISRATFTAALRRVAVMAEERNKPVKRFLRAKRVQGLTRAAVELTQRRRQRSYPTN